jgi:hypothetical protein
MLREGNYFKALAQGKPVEESRPLDADQTMSPRGSRSRNPVGVGDFSIARWNRRHKKTTQKRWGKAENLEH